jgi:hypothetical protein
VFLILIGIIIRLSHFPPKEEVNSDGEVTEKKVSFPFVCTTIFLMPALLVMFVLLEFQVKQEVLGLYFNFLLKPIGKGIFLIMMAMMLAEVP